jgi:hypothetical protein
VLSKVYGGTNPINVAKATLNALTNLVSVEAIAALRGRDVRLFHPQAKLPVDAAAVAEEPVPTDEPPPPAEESPSAEESAPAQ